MRLGTTGKGCLAALIALVGLALRGSAQATTDGRWTLEGNQGSYCIWYLADPALAVDLVPSSVTLKPAGTGAGLPRIVANYIRDEPQFAQWIPGSVCIGYYDRVTSEGKTLATSKPDRPVVIATSALWAQDPRGITEAGSYLVSFLTNERSIAKAGQDLGFNMNDLRLNRRPHAPEEDPEISIEFDGVQIIWSGHAVRDSSVGTTRSVSFGYAGARTTSWLVQLEAIPAATRLMAGALEVVGRNTLAKALKTSPVRAIGPEESGGTATFMFHLGTKR